MTCLRCGHDREAHVLAAINLDAPQEGGWGWCPHDGCECRFTWCVTYPGAPDYRARLPTWDEFCEIQQVRMSSVGALASAGFKLDLPIDDRWN
jgi:hypothetical protein